MVADTFHDDLDTADWAVLDALTGQIYECALDPALWDDTLTAIVAAFGPLEWDVAFLLWEGTSPPRARFVGATGLAAGIPQIYAAVYAGTNPWSRRIAPLRSGTVADTDELMTRAEFTASPLYRDFLQRWDMQRAIAMVLDRRGGERLALVLPGRGDRPVERLKRGLRVLAPHIQRAVRISQRIAVAELAAGSARAAADRANFGILSLDADLNILGANKRTAMFEAGGVIVSMHGRLRFTDAAAQAQLVALARSPPPGGAAFQAVGADGVGYAVLGARIAEQRAQALGGFVAGTALIISVGGGAKAAVIEIDRIAAWFGLTPAEARLAAALAAGTALQDFAAARAVSINAARFLLKSVFRKTRVSSQAQLVALIARLPA
jgi:DNA-binding CsgD family transcriptional regulator